MASGCYSGYVKGDGKPSPTVDPGLMTSFSFPCTAYNLVKNALKWDQMDWMAFDVACEYLEKPLLPDLLRRELRNPGCCTAMIESHLTPG